MNAMTTRALIALGALLVFGGINYSILHKETIKRNGEVIYMDLAPVDPRSLMQGDYMTLNFGLARQIEIGMNKGIDSPREGEIRYALVALDEKRVATYKEAPDDKTIKLRYRMRSGRVWLGTNGFFSKKAKKRFTTKHATVSFALIAQAAKRYW